MLAGLPAVVKFDGFQVLRAVFSLNNSYYCGYSFRFSEVFPASGLPVVVWSGVGRAGLWPAGLRYGV